ncbi:MAG: hypothetical protein VB081_04275 [Christensenella sp.]|uniref:hypothetical protein n=1 Tax=Christensenella sp. TaxID=1935934 RepID=UPI002B1F02C0|nr:hypothetical protein [Christensenella sp.]MEA5002693.1 hypothetical protein [Christensenella sp.]
MFRPRREQGDRNQWEEEQRKAEEQRKQAEAQKQAAAAAEMLNPFLPAIQKPSVVQAKLAPTTVQKLQMAKLAEPAAIPQWQKKQESPSTPPIKPQMRKNEGVAPKTQTNVERLTTAVLAHKGDVDDPFVQGLWGEQELKNDFVREELKKFTPALDARVKELREKINAKPTQAVEDERDTDTSMNMVYTMHKNDPKIVRDDIIAGATKVDPQTVGNMVQPLSASVTSPAQPTLELKPDKTGGSNLDLDMGPITQEKADEVRAATESANTANACAEYEYSS